ncbi:MAG: carbamate kinase [Syntrophobacterales bacterium]|nr:MAG: carbamate kinase [Syntrophobacterales bacterium]
MKETLLIALGGNALIKKGQRGSIEEQFENLRTPIQQIARLSKKYDIIITHGNGPQVGNLLLQQEKCPEVPIMPLEILVAQTQGQIGYMIESSLDNELMKWGGNTKQLFVTVLTYVVVDTNDPAFKSPSKPIGPFFSKKEAEQLPYPTVETADGYRRIVASPKPITIVEKREIKKLLKQGFLVIACGGGGIPVIREGREFEGVDAVIDKDLASAKLAQEVGVDIFLIATDTEGVAINFKKPGQRFFNRLPLKETKRLLQEGQFPEGSMGPKIEAAIEFLESGGKRVLVTSTENIECSVDGKAGTEITQYPDIHPL